MAKPLVSDELWAIVEPPRLRAHLLAGAPAKAVITFRHSRHRAAATVKGTAAAWPGRVGGRPRLTRIYRAGIDRPWRDGCPAVEGDTGRPRQLREPPRPGPAVRGRAAGPAHSSTYVATQASGANAHRRRHTRRSASTT